MFFPYAIFLEATQTKKLNMNIYNPLVLGLSELQSRHQKVTRFVSFLTPAQQAVSLMPNILNIYQYKKVPSVRGILVMVQLNLQK